MIKRISIPLSDGEYTLLQQIAQRGYRRVQDYARMIVLQSLQSGDPPTNTPAETKRKAVPTENGLAEQH